jgi:hypothetical protein
MSLGDVSELLAFTRLHRLSRRLCWSDLFGRYVPYHPIKFAVIKFVRVVYSQLSFDRGFFLQMFALGSMNTYKMRFDIKCRVVSDTLLGSPSVYVALRTTTLVPINHHGYW